MSHHRTAHALVLLSLLLCAQVGAATFTDATSLAGLDADGGSVGAAWGDYDADGCLDLFVSGHQRNRLYRSDCGGAFAEVSQAAGIAAPLTGQGVAWGDYDADGDLDLYVASEHWPSALYRNEGDGTFTEVAAAAGVDDERGGAGVAWGDYDADGDLDLFVANRWLNETTTDRTDRLYRNEGDGTFTDVSASAGVGGATNRKTFMGVWADLDANGTLDLYLSVDFGDDVLYRNEGNGLFTDVSAAAGIDDPQHGMGVAVGDKDADGCLDVVSTNGTTFDDPEHRATFVYRNDCNGTFSEDQAGIIDRGVVEWGVNLVDYDNDSDLDLAIVAGGLLSQGEPNILYENPGDGVLVDVTAAAGVGDVGASYASAWADYDGDGDLDWFVANEIGSDRLFRNDGPVGNWIAVELEGIASNRRGIGARIEVETAGLTQVRFLQAGSSYLSAEEAVAFVGLGGGSGVDQVRVVWPSGVVDELGPQTAGQRVLAREGEAIVNGGRLFGRTSAPDGQFEGDCVVQMRDLTTNVLTEVLSDATGRFSFDGLLPGSYRIRATKAGFVPSPIVDVVLGLGQSRNLRLKLRP